VFVGQLEAVLQLTDVEYYHYLSVYGLPIFILFTHYLSQSFIIRVQKGLTHLELKHIAN
jgi:hypothetical protein